MGDGVRGEKMKKDIKLFLIKKDITIKDAMKKMDEAAEKILFVINDNMELLGSLSDGDIRRWILKEGSLLENVDRIFNQEPIFVDENYNIESVKEIMVNQKIEWLPVVDKQNKIIDVLIWENIFKRKQKGKKYLDVPVVIMAGGKGLRLDPFTKILPKPLFPIGEKPIIEIIIDEFKKQGISEYYLTLNYKGEMIKSYFDNIGKDYEIRYIWEEGFFGTASSLKLLEKDIKDTFIVSNCDVIVKAKLEEVLNLHKERAAALTVLSSIQHHRIPYGVVKFKEGGEITEILEKPEYTFMVNAGVYVLSKESLRFIPAKEHFDMPDLVKTLIKNNKKVIIYPVNGNDYIDIGQWEEYKKALEYFRKLEIV